METQALKAALQAFEDRKDKLGVKLYAMLRGEEGEGFRKLDISAADDSIPNLKNLQKTSEFLLILCEFSQLLLIKRVSFIGRSIFH